MSETGGNVIRQPAGIQAHCALARGLLIALAMLAGCIIPPSLGVEQQDASIDSPPAIVSVRSDQQELSEYIPVVFSAHQMTSLNLTLIDSDVADTLYVRIFVDYTAQNPTAPRSTCPPTATGTSPERTTTCDLQGLCLDTDVGQTRRMKIVVFDRQVLDVGTPTFMATSGGLSTDRTYDLKCTS